jgi:NAD(P)-dependent dehydrogenase (short-subunit alcohol dehydrogenase family)
MGLVQKHHDISSMNTNQNVIPYIEYLQTLARVCSAQVWYYGCDITDIEATRALFQKAAAAARFPLRGLVTCAGISSLGRSIDFSIDEMRRIIDVNLTGTFVCAQSAAQEIFEQSLPASIVLIASMSGHVVNKVSILLSRIIVQD